MELESELNRRLKSHDEIGIGIELKAKSQESLKTELESEWNRTPMELDSVNSSPC